MTDESYIFLAGASRGVGREIAKCLTEQNKNVKALLRSEVARPELEALGIKVVMGDALDAAATLAAMQGNEPTEFEVLTLI